MLSSPSLKATLTFVRFGSDSDFSEYAWPVESIWLLSTKAFVPPSAVAHELILYLQNESLAVSWHHWMHRTNYFFSRTISSDWLQLAHGKVLQLEICSSDLLQWLWQRVEIGASIIVSSDIKFWWCIVFISTIYFFGSIDIMNIYESNYIKLY